MTLEFFLKSLTLIAKRDIITWFRDVWVNVILLSYFATGVVLWAATLGQLVMVKNYFQFLVVGLMVLGIYNTSYHYSEVVAAETRTGYIKYLLTLPLSKGGLTLGRVVAGALMGFVYLMLLVLFVAFLVGFPDPLGFLTLLLAVLGMSFCLSSLGIALATYVRPSLKDPAGDLIGIALIFSSTLYYPERLMPAVLIAISRVNLLSAGVNLMRAGFGLGPVTAGDIVVLSLWCLIFGIASTRGYYRRLQEISNR